MSVSLLGYSESGEAVNGPDVAGENLVRRNKGDLQPHRTQEINSERETKLDRSCGSSHGLKLLQK